MNCVMEFYSFLLQWSSKTFEGEARNTGTEYRYRIPGTEYRYRIPGTEYRYRIPGTEYWYRIPHEKGSTMY
ncbi:MAG: hypothetical protein FWH55_07815 [Oscillospiraceae bacterium]|nr:hypothetical protein [Oscillospiraceae bacterium]